MIDRKLDMDIAKLFENKPEASEFLTLYSQHGALIDDIVDEDKNINRIRLATLNAGNVFNCAYWRRNCSVLFLLDRLIHNMYFDSVEWEKATEEWKRQHAKVYSHSAMLMIFAVILLEFGEEQLRAFSQRIKEHAYNMHIEDKI